MKNRFLFIIVAITLCFKGYSQDLYFGFNSGIGSFAMTGLDKINNDVIESLPFDAKLVADFPAHIYYQPFVLVSFDNASVGMVYNLFTTGSKVSSKDYSGEYRFELKTYAHSPGIIGKYKLFSFKKIDFSPYSVLGASISTLRINEFFSIGENNLTDEDLKLQALNFYIEPGVSISYPLKSISIGINAGYSFQFGNEAYYYEEKENKLTIDNNPIKPDWNGFRLGLSIYYKFDINSLPHNSQLTD